ncbi:hypothetical protein BC833DRAFT_565276 [Globomyces pollinis-pini]|nr:hypothetical protein BC833DRAFT_565276 [Globomyces pollinis-pini]
MIDERKSQTSRKMNWTVNLKLSCYLSQKSLDKVAGDYAMDFLVDQLNYDMDTLMSDIKSAESPFWKSSNGDSLSYQQHQYTPLLLFKKVRVCDVSEHCWGWLQNDGVRFQFLTVFIRVKSLSISLVNTNIGESNYIIRLDWHGLLSKTLCMNPASFNIFQTLDSEMVMLNLVANSSLRYFKVNNPLSLFCIKHFWYISIQHF